MNSDDIADVEEPSESDADSAAISTNGVSPVSSRTSVGIVIPICLFVCCGLNPSGLGHTHFWFEFKYKHRYVYGLEH